MTRDGVAPFLCLPLPVAILISEDSPGSSAEAKTSKEYITRATVIVYERPLKRTAIAWFYSLTLVTHLLYL